jgi:hypothetical protein
MPPRDATQQAQAAPPAKRVLLLTSEDLADANEVPKPLRPLIEEAEDIYVLAPTLTTWLQWVASDVDRARVTADKRLRRVFDHMHADGLAPRGTVADEDQVVMIEDLYGHGEVGALEEIDRAIGGNVVPLRQAAGQ